MKTLRLEVFAYIYDDELFKLIDTQHKYSATYTGNIDIPKLETDLYSLLGERIRISTSHFEDLSIVSIDLLGDRSIERLMDYLSPYTLVNNNYDLYEHFSNINFEEFIQFSTAGEYLSETELDQIKEIFKEEGIQYKIISGNDIIEKGASSLEITYLIGVAGGLTVQLTMRLLDLMKSKLFDKESTDTIKIQSDVKNKLLNEYNLKPSEVYLSRIFVRKDGITQLTFQSKKDEFRIQVDFEGNIVKLNKYKKSNDN